MCSLYTTRGDIDPPALVCVDPRRTEVAKHATVHLAVRPGTNMALMNGLARQLIENGWIDEDYVERHTVGFGHLTAVVDDYPQARVAEICGVEAAAELFGTCRRPLSTVLQGFYQSNKATAASCGVNNLHLLRGALGKPGAGVLQMNGQPSAQNNRESGADGQLPGFRNWDNPEHVGELAELWDVDPMTIPHWAPPTHMMQIYRYVEEGSIGWLWIPGTNPAVSMPELERIRRILSGEQCANLRAPARGRPIPRGRRACLLRCAGAAFSGGLTLARTRGRKVPQGRA